MLRGDEIGRAGSWGRAGDKIQMLILQLKTKSCVSATWEDSYQSES